MISVDNIISIGITTRAFNLMGDGVNPKLAIKQAKAEHRLRESAFHRGMGGRADKDSYMRGEIKTKPMNFYSGYNYGL